MSKPIVTVLMSVYNGERYLREAIESILVQTWQDFELVCINDGSTDQSREIVLSFNDPRIRLVDNEQNLGLAKSLNKGLMLARGNLIARQDADDISEPDRLLKQVAFLEQCSEIVLVGSWYSEIDAKGNRRANIKLPCDYTDIRWGLLLGCPFVHSSVMFRKSAVPEKVGFYRGDLVYSEDYELWSRVARCLPVANLDEYLVRLRIHATSKTATYGEKVYIGRRIRIANMGKLLGWEQMDEDSKEARFSRIESCLFGSSPVMLADVEEIARLHEAFCLDYGISEEEGNRHWKNLYSELSSRLSENEKLLQKTAGDTSFCVRNNRVELSVIVPCRNPGPCFRNLLESLATQRVDAPWEVIIVDNQSSDDSRALALSFSDRLTLRIIDATEKANASYARNLGVRAASGEKLFFIDADDEVAPGYLAAMAKALDSYDFVTSRVDSATLNPPWACTAQGLGWQETSVETAFDFLPATGINVGIRRALFDSLGGFSEEYPGSQDIAFSWNVQIRKGLTIHFVPEAVYRYRHRATLREMFRQSCNWGSSNVLLFREFRKHGMPGKTVKEALWDWKDTALSLLKARTKSEFASQVVRAGYCVGRLKGSLQYRVLYL